MRDTGGNASTTPTIVVLLATHNGVRWLDEQVDSILSQEGVDVRIVALDDGSSDGTQRWLADRAATEPRLTVLADDGTGGSSARNFYRLIDQAEIRDGELVAFSDQDDRWRPDKLARHAGILANGLDGVSSSVLSFWSDGKTQLVRKDYPQREFDYLLESPGPGCSFLLTPRLINLVRETLRSNQDAREVEYHDSLIYAIARAKGWLWHIDGYPSVDYRQHDSNVLGSNQGVGAAMERLRLIREHWLRHHATLLTRVAAHVAPESGRPQLLHILSLLEGSGWRNRRALARLTPRLRRRPRDQRIIGLLITIGIW
ncbi:rhamnosyltransferase [Microbacteriaceae bacterium SG_E_30_P1]|uniref:Rhamnosyltransferase n=1 Tax=Antiquaquibacter oligotrophicus TaxID=2880260 RepID=A0ABT6KR95_9MICO|nr:glycosyltransferase [Antiquaquibacter oligotrophicus]MDH6181727.1 rhamnosyltransferase [Antiquaquibacter oligotrophicus]UDF12590.1 glycosyltransferase [Antiquaquibacter oligotrophicus]